jgi:hypothetical protein
VSDIITIRPSSLPSYQDCGRRTVARAMPWLARNAGFELRETPSPVGAAVGTACHASVAFSLTAKMSGVAEGDGLGNPTEAVQRGLQAFDEAVGQGVTWDDATSRVKDAHAQIQRMVLTYRTYLAPSIRPVAVEQRLVARIDERFVLSGQKDTRTREPNRIRDLKTGTRQRVNVAQYGAYALIDKAHGDPAEEVLEDYIPRVPLRKPQPGPQIVIVPAELAMRVAWSVIGRFAADVSKFLENGDPMTFPANPNSMLCTPKYCPAWGTKFCQEHRR